MLNSKKRGGLENVSYEKMEEIIAVDPGVEVAPHKMFMTAEMDRVRRCRLNTSG